MTIRALILSAFRLLGVTGAGDSLESSMGADALVSLSQLLDAWQTERLTVYAQTRTVHALTNGTSRYTIGSGGDFTEARPLWIDTAMLLVGGFEYRLRLFTRDEWAAVTDKSLAGLPAGIFYNPTYPLGAIDVFPVPNASCSLVLYVPAASLTSATSLDTVLSLPPAWARALRYNLALELAPEYNVQPSGLIVKTATDAKAEIQRTNILADTLRVDGALTWFGRRSSVSPADFASGTF